MTSDVSAPYSGPRVNVSRYLPGAIATSPTFAMSWFLAGPVTCAGPRSGVGVPSTPSIVILHGNIATISAPDASFSVHDASSRATSVTASVTFATAPFFTSTATFAPAALRRPTLGANETSHFPGGSSPPKVASSFAATMLITSAPAGVAITTFAPVGARTGLPAASTSVISRPPRSPAEAFVSSLTMLATSARSPTANTRWYVSLAPAAMVTFFFCSVSVHAPPLMAAISPSGVVIA